MAAPALKSGTVAKTFPRKVHAGNHIVVSFGGAEVGLVQSLRASDDYAPEPASGIGSIQVEEYVPTVARHSLSVSQMVLKAQNMRIAGATDENGAIVVQGGVFDISVWSNDGTELRKYTGCTYASGDIEVSAHKIVVSNASFNALDVFHTSI